jgi:membrane-associated protease RseP (regulator of RpoE activity)
MHHFMWRGATAVLAVLAAFAISANAQAPPNTSSNANKNQPSVQPNAGATNAPQPAATNAPAAAQPSATQRAQRPRFAQKQAVPNTQPQVDPNAARQRDLLNQPGGQVQPTTPSATARLRAGVPDASIQTNQGNLTGGAVTPDPRFFGPRTVLRPNEMRGPDMGFWFTRPVRDGLVISDITPVGPITRLGFREGDRIVSVSGQAVTTERQFIDLLLADTVNPVQVVVLRNGRNETIAVDPTILTQQQTFVADVEPLEQFGIVLDDRFNDRIVVWRVLPGTPAFYAGFRPGDVITTLSGQLYRTRVDFEKAIVGLRAGEIPVSVLRANRPRDLVVDVPQFQRTAQRPAIQPGQPALDRSLAPGAAPRDERQAEGTQPRGSNPAINQPPENRPAPNAPEAPRGERR